MTEQQQLDRKDLKIQALRERINELEDNVADLRVELTLSNTNYQNIITQLNLQLDSLKSDSQDIVEGIVEEKTTG